MNGRMAVPRGLGSAAARVGRFVRLPVGPGEGRMAIWGGVIIWTDDVGHCNSYYFVSMTLLS